MKIYVQAGGVEHCFQIPNPYKEKFKKLREALQKQTEVAAASGEQLEATKKSLHRANLEIEALNGHHQIVAVANENLGKKVAKLFEIFPGGKYPSFVGGMNFQQEKMLKKIFADLWDEMGLVEEKKDGN